MDMDMDMARTAVSLSASELLLRCDAAGGNGEAERGSEPGRLFPCGAFPSTLDYDITRVLSLQARLLLHAKR